MTGDPVSWNRSMVSRMAASYNSWSSSSEHRPSLNSRIPSRSSGGLGMLPIGSVGMDMTRNLLPHIVATKVGRLSRGYARLPTNFGLTWRLFQHGRGRHLRQGTDVVPGKVEHGSLGEEQFGLIV